MNSNSPTRKKLLSCTVRLAIALIGCASAPTFVRAVTFGQLTERTFAVQTPTTQADQLTNSFRVAKFYDKQRYYRAAVVYYNEVIRQQPGSEESKQAKKRIDQLRAQFGNAALQPYVQAHPEYHKPRGVPSEGSDSSSTGITQTRRKFSGTGFFITDDGYLITNEHVAGNGAQVRLITSAGLISAKVIKADVATDIALLKAEGKFAVLPVAASRSMKLGGTVATVGFPNVGLQGFSPKFARGEIGSLSGMHDDARYFQISVPVQPGNSGGPLVDERGNVVGVVSGKLNPKATLFTNGSLPENVLSRPVVRRGTASPSPIRTA